MAVCFHEAEWFVVAGAAYAQSMGFHDVGEGIDWGLGAGQSRGGQQGRGEQVFHGVFPLLGSGSFWKAMALFGPGAAVRCIVISVSDPPEIGRASWRERVCRTV